MIRRAPVNDGLAGIEPGLATAELETSRRHRHLQEPTDAKGEREPAQNSPVQAVVRAAGPPVEERAHGEAEGETGDGDPSNVGSYLRGGHGCASREEEA